jgi:hypothetical protein
LGLFSPHGMRTTLDTGPFTFEAARMSRAIDRL